MQGSKNETSSLQTASRTIQFPISERRRIESGPIISH